MTTTALTPATCPTRTLVHTSPQRRTAMTLRDLRARRTHPSRLLIGGMAALVGVGLNLPGRRVRFKVEGADHLPEAPVLFACNHTHRMDWLAVRWLGFLRGRAPCGWVKPRTYEEGYGRFLDWTGNVPLASRGYLISADFRALFGRVPTEEEYRALRRHLDIGAPLPDEALYRVLTTRIRDILGVRFDPTRRTWREAMEQLFAAMMRATLHHTASLVGRGHDLMVFPQGAFAHRLTRGHPGALQAALALDIPIVPVGISGFPQAYGDSDFFPVHGGDVTVRFGSPYRPVPIQGHRPFVPSSERIHAQALAAGTEGLMERIAELVDEEHGWSDDRNQTDIQGVARFV